MRFKVIVSYDGTSFNGWQKQNDVRTIQQELEDAIAKIEERDVQIVGSGRTDAKVHARAQVFHFDALKPLTESDWFRALNGLTSDAIKIESVTRVSEKFHARYDAIEKTYYYLINTGTFDVFSRNYIYQYGQKLAVDKIKEAAELFEGTHDYSSFNATPLDEIPDQVRTIKKITIDQEGDLVTIGITGDGFLRYMVRIIVGSLIAVSEEKLTTETIALYLSKPRKAVIPYKAPAHGLSLMKVNYKDS